MHAFARATSRSLQRKTGTAHLQGMADRFHMPLGSSVFYPRRARLSKSTDRGNGLIWVPMSVWVQPLYESPMDGVSQDAACT